MRAEQRGVAVVLAMGIVAFASIAATAIMTSQSVWSRQSQLASEYVQAQVMVQAGIDWMRAILNDDRRMSSVDHLQEPWALQMPAIPIEKGELAANIEDRQGLFNLNNLVQDGKVSDTHLAHFKRLLVLLDLPEALADSLADWMDADSEQRLPGGAEDEYYLTLKASYLTANRQLADVAGLARVRGFDSATRASLRPFVTALPGFTITNVNTAPPEVLTAVVKDLGIGNARLLIAQREQAFFRDHADFLKRLPQGATVEDGDIGVSSDYFLATLHASIGEVQARGTALLARTDAGWPAVVWRKYP